MTMEQPQFEARVTAMENLARARPRAYRIRVTAFALLGYGFLSLVVTSLLALLVAAMASIVYLKALGVKIALAIGALVWVVLRALVVRISPPAGIVLDRREVPALFERIEHLRRAIGAPRFHRVVVNEDFNAAVTQVPLFGLFGWYRNYLVLGLPLLRALHPRQFDAVLAHEIGHLAGGHARLGNWLYRLRMIWTQLLDELHRAGHRSNGLIRRFFDWYVPRFNAYSFPLARANEYEADAVSAKVTSPDDAAQALTAVHVVAAYLDERYWPGLLARADDSPQPAYAPYSRLGDSLGEALADGTCDDALVRVLALPTTSANTHPGLADRLRALGAEPKLNLPEATTAAWQLLGTKCEGIAAQLDRRWQDLVAHDWRMRHEHVQHARSRLAELDQAAQAGELDIDSALERVRLARAYGNDGEAALTQLRELHARASDSAVVNHVLGIHLLERGDESGRAHIDRAIALDPAAAAPGYTALRDFYWRQGETETAHGYHTQATEAIAEDDAAQIERSRLQATDRLVPSGLEARTLVTLGEELARIGGIRCAWIGRKHLQAHPHVPLYVLGFRLSWSWRFFRNQRREQAVRDAILRSAALPGETFVLCVDCGVARRIGAALSEHEEATIPLPGRQRILNAGPHGRSRS